jgi:hypothetical protein
MMAKKIDLDILMDSQVFNTPPPPGYEKVASGMPSPCVYVPLATV